MPSLNFIPLLVPGAVASAGLAVLLARPVGSRLGIHPLAALLLVGSVGLILSATLSPSPEAFRDGEQSSGLCDTSRYGLASWRQLTSINDISLNVLLFIPLGVALRTLRRRRSSLVLIVAAVYLPVLIELTQLVVPKLDRACQTADVFDNLTGLVIGVAAMAVLQTLVGPLWRRLRA